MKIIQQKILYFKEGNSDKVYEVDLCESGDDLFIVNFRYGRRESVLREGTKTVFPVLYDEAIKIFEKLILAKEKKGYSESGEVAKTIDNSTQKNTLREETIIRYLKEGAAGNYLRNDHWKLSKVIAKAGELKITASANDIQSFIISEDEFEQYEAIKALANFNDASAANTIYSIFKKLGFENKVGRIAIAYLLKLKPNNYPTEIIREVKQKLPFEWKDKLDKPSELLGAMAMHFIHKDSIDPMALYYLYLVSYEQESLRSPLIEFINTIKFEVNTFKSIRYIFRTCALNNDLDFYALIAKKIGVDSAGYSSDYVYHNDEYTWVEIVKKSANPSVAFSAKTKQYFIRLIYKYVYLLSRENKSDFIQIATRILCLLNDQIDKSSPITKWEYFYNNDTQNYNLEPHHFPRYSKFSTLMYLLYGNSEQLKQNKLNWYYLGDVRQPESQIREEVLPEEWDKHPQEVLQILSISKSEDATWFAFRILKDNIHFLESAQPATIHDLVNQTNDAVVQLVLDFIKEKYADSQPEDALLFALLKSTNKDANEMALEWLKKYESEFLSKSDFIVALLLSGNPFLIAYLRNIYKDEVKYQHSINLSDISSLFALPTTFEYDYLLEVSALIGEHHFGKLFLSVTKEDIKVLLETESTTNILFAANLCKSKSDWSFEIFQTRVDGYVKSEDAVLRKIGIELLGFFPNAFLLENSLTIAAYYFSEFEEVRIAIQPAIGRLIGLNSSFKVGILNQSLKTLCEAEVYEGLHETIYQLLTKEYGLELNTLSQSHVLELIVSKYDYAQKLGMPLFRQKIRLPNFTLDEIVLISKSDVKEARDFLPIYFEKNVIIINYELEKALRIFNSDWKDVLDWSFPFFEEHIQPKNWTLDTLLYVCDHTKEKVQAFGRKMVTTHFTNDKGLDLLLKIQEHPTKTMQFFTTNYLNTYAKDKPDIILRLKDFFKTVLFGINEGRITKNRVFAFLEQESIKDENVAKMTIALLDSILSTKTLIDQSKCIDLLLTISENHSDLNIPLIVKTNLVK